MNLAQKLGSEEIYIKDDTVNPADSFKDRPATVAVTKARELGFESVGCVSTGNLVAAPQPPPQRPLFRAQFRYPPD